jgi:hypothetical protein
MGIRVELVPQFYMGQEDALLMAIDGVGIDQLIGALRQAAQSGGSPSVLRTERQTHTFIQEETGGIVELKKGDVVWHLSATQIEEITDKLEAMKSCSGPCHHYVDIMAPTESLVLSRDEYPDPLT